MKILEYLLSNYDFDDLNCETEKILNYIKLNFDINEITNFLNIIIFFENFNKKLSNKLFELI